MLRNRKIQGGLVGIGMITVVSIFPFFNFPSSQPFAITAKGNANQSGLRFDWDVKKERKTEVNAIKVVVSKDGKILQTADTQKLTGTYFITPYRQGVYSLEIIASGNEKSRSETKKVNVKDKVVISTKGNLPSPCPSHAVWSPTGSAGNLTRLHAEHAAPLEIVSKSQLIFAGNVTAIEFCAPPTSKSPYTFITFEKLQIIHGSYTDSMITIAIPGGVMDGKVSQFVHMPRFKRGERTIVFLTARPKHLSPILGWEDGVFLVENKIVKNIDSQPVISLSKENLEVDSRVSPRPKAFDQLYGYEKISIDNADKNEKKRKGPSGRETVPVRSQKDSLTEEEFIALLQKIVRESNLKTPVAGKLLPPGTPFELKPIKAVPGSNIKDTDEVIPDELEEKS